MVRADRVPASYTVYYDGTYYHALANTCGGTNYKETVKQTAVQDAIDALEAGSGGSIYLRDMEIPSGLSYGATIMIIEDYFGVIKYYNNETLIFRMVDGGTFVLDVGDRADDTILVYDSASDTFKHEGFPIADIADQNWDETVSEHTASGSFGEAVNNINTQTAIVAVTEGSPFVLQNNTDEQTMLEISPSVVTKLHGIKFDIDALTQTIAYIKVYEKIDGINYREYLSMRLSGIPASIPAVVFKDTFCINTDFKITIQMSVAEGATRNIPYRYFKEEMTA